MTLVPNYVPTDWVDNVTPVDESHMDKIDVAVDQHADAINALDTRLAAEEAQPDVPAVVNGKWVKGVSGAMVWSDITQADVSGLSAALNGKQDTSAKGVANGYASLDSGGKVPTTQLPVSIDLRWAGNYAPATAYKEGDVVIYNGVSYIALRPSTGETPAPWSSAAGGALQSVSNVLATDQALTATNTDYDGPILTSLAVGTWLITGSALITRAGNTGFVDVRLWDGTTVYGVAEGHTSQFASGQGFSMALSAIVTLSAITTLKISARATGTGHIMRAAGVSTLAPAGVTYLNAVKIG
jgi:hypothetical protein